MAYTSEQIKAYAQERADATGKPYIITNFGHCFMDCAGNRKIALDPEFGEGIKERVMPRGIDCGIRD